MDLIERFRYVMKLNAMTASQFADEIGVQRSSISHILSGRNKPSLEFIQKVITRFPKVDSTWLINGKTNVGEVPKIDQGTPVKIIEKVPEMETKEVRNLVSEEIETENEGIKSSEKRIKKVVVFYDNGTFEEFTGGS